MGLNLHILLIVIIIMVFLDDGNLKRLNSACPGDWIYFRFRLLPVHCATMIVMHRRQFVRTIEVKLLFDPLLV